MKKNLLAILRCPVTRKELKLKSLRTAKKIYNHKEEEIIYEGILFSEEWFYPIIKGIPRLLVESFIDYEEFFHTYLEDYELKRDILMQKYRGLIRYVTSKNKSTKQSFEQEWNLYNYKKDKTWDEDADGMLTRFLKEVDKDENSLTGKFIFDAGCGNGILDSLIAEKGAIILAMDLSRSIEKAFANNFEANAFFIQGDIQFPPVKFDVFDIVHASGVLIHTNNAELSFTTLSPCVKRGGMLSVWLYHPRKDFIHNFCNHLRRFTSKLSIRFQFYLYALTLFPLSFLLKKMKGNNQNAREMMIDILDWFSPKYRWEISHEEAISWFIKQKFINPKVTTISKFGFNIIGSKL